MAALSPDDKATLADLAGTTKGQLYQLTGGHRNCSADLAIRLEHAAAKMRKKNPELPPLARTDLCAACRGCEYAKACTRG